MCMWELNYEAHLEKQRDMNMGSAKMCIADLQQQVQLADKRCGNLKSQLNYMRMLYSDIRPEADETKEPTENPNTHAESSTEMSPLASIKIDSHDTEVSEPVNDYNFLKKIQEIRCASRDDTDAQEYNSPLSPMLNNISAMTDRHCNSIEKLENVNANDIEGANEEDNLTVTQSKTYPSLQENFATSRSISPIHENNMHSYERSLTEHSALLQEDPIDSNKSFQQLILESQNEYLLQELSSVKEDIQLSLSGSVRDRRTTKRKYGTEGEKKERINSSSLASKKGSTCKMDSLIPMKLKRRKGKLRCSNSKSTVTTKDSNLLGRKDLKKRKHKGGTTNRHANVARSQQITNDVVEIYHNAAAKSGSTSVLSSRHSRLDRQTNRVGKPCATISERQGVRARVKREDNAQLYGCNTDQENEQNCSSPSHQVKKRAEGANANPHDQGCKSEATVDSTCAVDQCCLRQYQRTATPQDYCDSLIAHNYEMPTLASKLKRANRSYFSRFNFRNIPFVVGTSVTPSHNLGLNIQQVLSIMKTRQQAVNGITPLLIRKVSQGMKPVSVLMEQINDEYSKLNEINSRIMSSNINPQMINTSEQKENSFVCGPSDLMENEHPKYDKPESNERNPVSKSSTAKQYENVEGILSNNKVTCEDSTKQKDIQSKNQLNKFQQSGCTAKNAGDIKIIKPFTSHQNIKSRATFSNASPKTCQDNMYNEDFYDVQSLAQSHSTKGIREVLINLHDQFEEMNAKYEKLQSKAEKSNDKDWSKEISNLEKELNAKEEEINAVVSLYKEVMALKHQMKMLQEKNSFVCISTEVQMNSNKAYSAVPLTVTKSYGTNLQQGLPRRKGNGAGIREPSTSIRLAGLLRQIQTFQKQLKLS